MRYCGVVGAGPYLQLATLEEVRTEEPPIRLHARFYEPASPAQLVSELRGFEDAVIGIGAPLTTGPRKAGEEMQRRGVPQGAVHEVIQALVGTLGLGLYAGGPSDVVEEGAY